jgi:hypothetical protein
MIGLVEPRASDYLEVDSVPWKGMLFALVRNVGAIVAGLAVLDWPDLGRPMLVRVRARATGRVLAQYEYGATEGADAHTHIAMLNKRLAEMSAAEFCQDLGINLQPEDLPAGAAPVETGAPDSSR